MAYKRQIDRLPIVPTDAKESNVTCHYCIVGCGYKAYTWAANKQGGTAAGQNKFGVDLAKQQPADTGAWYSPSMYNIVKQNGEDVHIVIKPDKDCVVNSGLGSVRGARMAEMSYSRARNTQLQRLTDPMVWRYGQMQPTSWDDALDLVARVTVAVINDMGEDGLFVSAFDHGGAGGGYENTWGTGKLYFEAMKVKNIRIHNRPAYNSEVHATRDMGVGELNNCYEDAELADTIVAVGTNALETQTNYFLNHWVPNLRGTSVDKKKQPNSATSRTQPARIVIVDPRRTVTVNACEAEAGKDRVMHLAINSGTDLALFNAWLTYISRERLDRQSIHRGFNQGLRQGRWPPTRPAWRKPRRSPASPSIRFDSRRSGLPQPKQGGARRRTMFAYEKGLIWGNDNYRTNGALVNVALATGNIGRPGGGCVRMGGHQEGYSRPSDAHVGRPAAYVDQLLIEGKGGVHHIWGCDHYKTTLNALKFKQAYKKRTDLVKDAMSLVPSGDRVAMVNAIVDAIKKGGLFAVDVDIVPTQIGQACHVMLPAATSGESKPDLDERRAAHAADRALHGPARSGHGRLPHRGAYRQPHGACLARAGQGAGRRQVQGLRLEDRRRRLHGRLPQAREGRRVRHLCPAASAMGTNGFQEPAVDFKDGKIVGTKRLFADGKFGSKDGKATFMETKWRGLQAAGKEAEKNKWPSSSTTAAPTSSGRTPISTRTTSS